MTDRALRRFRVVGFAEGVSFLVLLGVAMPLKYLADMPMAVKVVGWLHGLLFVAYVVALLGLSADREWPASRMIAGLAAAVLPFGPFFFDRTLRERAAT